MNIKQLLIWAVLPSCLVWLLGFIIPRVYTSGATPYIIVFFTILNMLFNNFYIKFSAGKDARTLVGVLMALIGVKFIISIFAVAVYLYLNKTEQHIGFAINFFIVYMIFAVYETRTLLAHTKQ